MNYLSVENLAKRYGEHHLFENLSFGIEKGQKVALVAPNGTGKTSLFNILAGIDTPDQGEARFRKEVRIGFLPQEPPLDPQKTILETILQSDSPANRALRFYEQCLETQSPQLGEALAAIDALQAWGYEQRLQQILSSLRITDLSQTIATLSGGQRKRVALAQLFMDEPDFWILDEPTNHLDLDMIEWLEEHLSKANITLLMVTHDRHFLDQLCNEILEIDAGKLYRYSVPNNRQGEAYYYFLEKKEERISQQTAEIDKAKNLWRKELDWVRRQPKARGTKAKYRLDAFQEIQKKAFAEQKNKKLQLETDTARLGKKIVEWKQISKKFEQRIILEKFSYTFQRYERLGIVGKNGTGKTTLLNLLTQKIAPDTGNIEIGETIRFGYYTQEGLQLKNDQRVIEVIQNIADQLPDSTGRSLSATQWLDRFLFPPKRQYAYVSTLSGGERRRLYLLTILVQNPNFLILDEPTNDLDLITLQVLEDFLQNYEGCLVIVSHDRHFMDKLVEHLWILEGDGKIRDFNGNYGAYRALLELEEEEKNTKPTHNNNNSTTITNNTPKRKRSYKEQKEYESLEAEIEILENLKVQKVAQMNVPNLSYEEVNRLGIEVATLSEQIDQKSMRWLELSELAG
ncbi:MAG: ABC transporter ATP-binding protein [Cytophagales bacterium]|nr:MAG: ABC transporter ATP-binding protein [Cytophagales bacterium]